MQTFHRVIMLTYNFRSLNYCELEGFFLIILGCMSTTKLCIVYEVGVCVLVTSTW